MIRRARTRVRESRECRALRAVRKREQPRAERLKMPMSRGIDAGENACHHDYRHESRLRLIFTRAARGATMNDILLPRAKMNEDVDVACYYTDVIVTMPMLSAIRHYDVRLLSFADDGHCRR